MSIEIILHPQEATKTDLRQLLLTRGYAKCGHLWQWPKGSANYQWYEYSDFKSFDGVEATIYPPAEEDRHEGDCGWALHTRSRASASTFDRVEQNALIREARRRFGGSFYNDWYGKNRYIQVPPEERCAAGRGIFLLYEFVTQQVRAVEFTLPNLDSRAFDGRPLPEPLAQHDPARVLYNALVPFAVAALEHFFGEAFRILLHYERGAHARLVDHPHKVEMRQLMSVSEGQQTVEEVVASWYSFQNLNGIHKAFDDWLDIDVWGILRARRRLGRRVAFLDEHLQWLIQRRHGVVHHFELDPEIDREALAGLLGTVLAIVDTFVDHLEGPRGIKIRD